MATKPAFHVCDDSQGQAPDTLKNQSTARSEPWHTFQDWAYGRQRRRSENLRSLCEYNDAQIATLPRFEISDAFTPREKDAQRLAARLTRNERPLDEAELADLRLHFTVGEIVELMAARDLFNHFNRFNNLLAMEADAGRRGVEPATIQA